MELSELVKPYTITSQQRIAAMISALHKIDADNIEGDIVECGVFRGGNIIAARKICPNRVCWLYDTFSGMTKPTEVDVPVRHSETALEKYWDRREKKIPWCANSVKQVRNNLHKTDTLDDAYLRFIVGDVYVTLQVPDNIPDKIALLRLDTDWYESTKVELEVLYPQLVPGGVLIVDDYGHWNGARKAVDEYFNGSVPFVEIDYTAIKIVKP